jgi:hypothetical protein
VVRAGGQPRARRMDLLIAATAHDAAVYIRDAEDLIGLETLIEVVSP